MPGETNTEGPFPEWRVTVKDEWLDYNGHFNMGYYVVAFDYHATDPLYDILGIGEDYIAEHNMSVYTISSQVNYFAEGFAGDEMVLTTRLLKVDARRLHYVHTMWRDDADDGVVERKRIAMNELVAINVDLATKRATVWPDGVEDGISAFLQSQPDASLPKEIGRPPGW